MKKEKSCGAVIYKVVNNTIYYYIIKQERGHIAFPKGHVEEGETEEETATREIKEETNIDVLIDNKFKEISTYSPAKDIIKDVIFFVALALNEDIKPQKGEVAETLLVNYDEALSMLTYERDKEILEKADIYIKNKLSNKN